MKHACGMCEASEMARKSSPSMMGPFTNSTIPKYLASASSRSFVQQHGIGIMQSLLTPKSQLHAQTGQAAR